MIDSHLPTDAWCLERPKRHPKSVLDLRVERYPGPRCQRECKWSNHNGRQHGSPRIQVFEYSQPLNRREIDTDFFVCFADCGREEIGVAWFSAPARKGDLTRPGVAGPYGAMDEEYFEAVAALMKQNCYRGGDRADLVLDSNRVVLRQGPAGVLQRSYAETSSPPSTLITLPVIQSAPG